MALPRRARVVAALACLALLLAGCGGTAEPSPTVAGARLAGFLDSTRDALTDGVQPSKPWTATEDGSTEDTDGCGDDLVRRAYAATVDVPASSGDIGNRLDLVAGQLEAAGWKTLLPDVAPTAELASVSALRAGTDTTRSKIVVEISPAGGGWHYEVQAKTACLPKR